MLGGREFESQAVSANVRASNRLNKWRGFVIKKGWLSFSGETGVISGANMVTTALLIFFWAVVPGLITGWMLRERGRSFLPGLLLGALFGPLGILGVLTFI